MIRKKLTTILRRIIAWRKEQPKSNTAIIAAWQEYTLTADGLRKGWQCYNCNKRSNGIHYVMLNEPPATEPYFCSSECEQQFKSILRQA